MNPKRGTTFRHRYWFDGDTNEQLQCVVTKVQHGLVYWRALYADGRRGACYTNPLDKWIERYGQADSN